jgi:hypothetical protein
MPGTTPIGGFPNPNTLRKATDRDFLAYLDHVVALFFDETAAGTGTAIGKYGGVTDKASRFKPVLGYEEIPCHVALKPPEPTEGIGRPGWVTPATISFGMAVPADRRFCVDWLNPLTGDTLRLYLKGPVKEQPGGHHWTAYAQDQPL